MMEKKRYFPMFMDLSDKKVMVVGAGTIAKRRVRTLLEFTEHVYVLAPEVNPELKQLAQEGRVTILKKRYEPGDLNGMDLVIAAASEAKVNFDVADDCRQQGILVNVANDRDQCGFYFPGVILKENVVIGVSASGQNQKLARKVSEAVRCAVEEI
ncbi:MAG: bifunctional precorrin-2 dehydrogenase/sirohydrochlorin ferrochelatase [Lachnospiraceae bacterium]|nr:bifunctional precorrin-2 dehydrogenase/sirohydrochlorin ferrochelatase [Lachnospiraceae bacterium]